MENSTSFGCGGSCGILVGMKRLPLIVIAVLLVASALVVASRPAAADQNDDRLDKLFMRLLEAPVRSEEHTSELQSLMRISYAVFCLKKKTTINNKIYKKIQVQQTQ